MFIVSCLLHIKHTCPCEIVTKRVTSDKGSETPLNIFTDYAIIFFRLPGNLFFEKESNEETMSISEAASHRGHSGDFCCPRCNTPLLPQATFCSSCGERLDNKSALSSLLQDEQDIGTRYRITSLLRRRPRVNLYFALDNQQSRQAQQRMVAIRDIDITPLHDEARVQAIELVQQEYDLLRRWHLPHVMPVVDLRYFQGHLFVIASYPSKSSDTSTTGTSQNTGASTGNIRRLYTLHDFLQSGQGLPSEQQALKWIWNLCQALDGLHRHQIVIGELDPHTIILNENSVEAEPALMISWLPPHVRELLPPLQASTAPMSYFCAPEALQGKAEPRSDIYSLGAILYLLLTGSPPGDSTLRARGRLRTPRELNARTSPHVNDCVMQALAIEPAKRFESALVMSEALFNPRYSRLQTLKLNRRDNEVTDSPVATESDVETIRIDPLSQRHLARWRASRPQTATPNQIPHRPLTPRPTSQPQEVEAIQAEWQQQPIVSLQSVPLPATPPIDANREALPVTPGEQVNEKEANESRQVSSQDERTSPPPQTSQNLSMPTRKQHITGMMPATASKWLQKSRSEQVSVSVQSPIDAVETIDIDTHSQNKAATTWFKQLQRVILGQQQRAIMAAALVESPLRVQPNQVFTIRMHVVGRDEPTHPPGAKEGNRSAGLSSLVHGNTVSIEVRSVLHQSYAYVVQQATITIPAAGYVAEVTIPVQPLSSAPSGRRDQLHIFFLDEQRHPLYEKPFIVEVFVSHLVKRGHEGHHVLTIPF
jgi:serine/threonine protein kinase